MSKITEIIATAIVALLLGATAVAIVDMAIHVDRYIQQPQQMSSDAAPPPASVTMLSRALRA